MTFKKSSPSEQKKAAKEFMMEDLARSGLNTAKTIKQFKFVPRTATEIQELIGNPNIKNHGYEIPFPHLDKPFYRFRVDASSYSGKYTQERSSGNHVYLPFNPASLLKTMRSGEQCEVHIYEGEKKTIVAHQCGIYHPVGITGCWNWSGRDGRLLQEIAELCKGNHIVVTPDGDYFGNEQVHMGYNRFMSELRAIGCTVELVRMPDEEGLRGFDDLIISQGIEAYEELELLDMSSDPVQDHNHRCVYMKELNSVFDLKDRVMLRTKAEMELHYGNIIVRNPETEEKEPVMKLWLRSPHRLEVRGFTYNPNTESLLVEEDGQSYVNQYQDDSVPAKKGSIKPFMDFLKFVMPKKIPETDVPEYDHLLDMIAFKLQNLSTKMKTHVIMYSEMHQVGKSTITNLIMPALFGPSNWTVVGQSQLEEQYTGYLKNKLGFAIEEMSVSRFTAHVINNKMKDVQTSEIVTIREMRRDAYTLPNYITMFCNSNSWPPAYLEKHDTRNFCISINNDERYPEFKELYKWMRKDGLSFIKYNLLHRNVRHFDPNASAPDTILKSEIVEANEDEEMHWIRRTLPERLNGQELATGKEIFQWFLEDSMSKRAPSQKQLINKLKKFGKIDQKRFKMGGNQTVRLYILDNSNYWKKAGSKEAYEHLKRHGAVQHIQDPNPKGGKHLRRVK